MSTVNIEQIKEANTALKQLFTIPSEQQMFQWSRVLYSLVPTAWFEVRGSITDPNGRSYVAVRLIEDSYIDQIKVSQDNPHRYIEPHDEVQIMNFSTLAEDALKALKGVAIISTEENQRPDALIRFGSIWSCYEYKELAGCDNSIADFEKAFALNPDNPFDIIVQDTTHFTIGTPSEAFFPPYVRDLIGRELKSVYPSSSPDFSLLTETRYAIPISIMIDLHVDISDDTKKMLQAQISWFMPPYLPVSIR